MQPREMMRSEPLSRIFPLHSPCDLSNSTDARKSPMTKKKVLALLEEAANDGLGDLRFRLECAREWARHCGLGRPTAAYSAALSLLDITAVRSQSVKKRYANLSGKFVKASKGLAVDAAAAAIEEGNVAQAIEQLEQGRALLFAGLGRYRTSLDDVQMAAPHLAKRLLIAGQRLDEAVIGGRIEANGDNRFGDDSMR